MPAYQQNGIVIGIVKSLEDPEQLGRVRVEYKTLGDQQSDWARLVTLMGGPDRGARFLPEVNDEVLVAFEQGDPRRPYILGALWSKVDKPPPDDGKQKDNNWRYIKSRSGHILRFDDTDSKEKIEILDKDNKRKLIIDAAGKKIIIICEEGDISLSAKKGKVSVEADEVNVESQKDMSIKAGGTLTLKGQKVNIN
jgi:uncharacterized protein involved in type VI secretion and phage assembly